MCLFLSEDWLDEEPLEERAISEWIREFKQHYMSTHSLSETTWKRHWQTVYDNLPQDGLLVSEALVAIALDTPPNTRKRREYCLKLQKLADFAEVELNLKPYRGNYSSTKPQNVRKLPTDEMVGEWLAKISNPAWRSFYGIVATFGLRPHEFWFCHFIDALTIQVAEGKTGERQVQALYPEWVERWELRDIQRPNVTARFIAIMAILPAERLCQRASTQFRRYGLPFSPYDLRHAWAIRASITFRLPDTIAARMMGHSVDVHNKTYHRWLSRAKQADVYQTAIQSGPKAPE